MSQITLQGKQQALMRVAASRVATLDAVSSTKEHVSRCVGSLPVSPSTLLRLGAVAGGAASALGVISALRRKKKKAEKLASRQKMPSPALFQLLMQVLAPVLIPAAQRALLKWGANVSSPENGHSLKF